MLKAFCKEVTCCIILFYNSMCISLSTEHYFVNNSYFVLNFVNNNINLFISPVVKVFLISCFTQKPILTVM